MSWKPSVLVQGTWGLNGLVFATKEEAEASALDLMMRWTATADAKAVESTDPVNYKRVDGRDVHIGEVVPL